jgi:hypothetical protein
MNRKHALGLAVCAALAPTLAAAAYLDADGRGQALIYPYYTVQSANGNAFNTYISVANHNRDSDKALRVRFRESLGGREVASLNLYLGRNDVWTAAIVPEGDGARLITRDSSCTEPAIWSGNISGGAPDGMAFRNANFAGSNGDGGGEGLDRTREGYIEILEMASVNNVAPLNLATAITHTTAGVPANCATVQPNDLATTAPAGTFTAPTGGLSGTLTLINVANGMDFSLNAEAIGDVARRPYFRASADPYPSFAAGEIEPVSVVMDRGLVYRSSWPRGADAVSAVLMRRDASAEFTLEPVTASQTDFVFTFPTRPHYLSSVASPPFTVASWGPNCSSTGAGPVHYVGELVAGQYFNRSQRGGAIFHETNIGSPPPVSLCATAAVVPVANYGLPSAGQSLLGARSLGAPRPFRVNESIVNGTLEITFTGGEVPGAAVMVSEPGSVRTDIATGQSVSGRHTFRGLPVTGFSARTLRNGTLSCTGGTCQGNYGSAFPFTYQRSITGP